MKRNTIIKVMSASILAASLAVVDFPTNLQKTKYIHAVGTQEVSVDVAAHLLNANNSGQRSMGDAALEKVSIKKVGNQYQYTIIWKDLNFNGQSDGISKFWVKGTPYPVTYTREGNQEVHFTSSEKHQKVPVSVFVKTMEEIMPGAGKKDAILSLDWSHSREEPGKFYVTGGDPGENPDEGPSGGKQAKGDKANGNSTDNSSEDNDGRVDNSEEFSNTGSNSKTGLNNKTNFKNKTNLKSPYVIIPSAISLLGAILVFIKRRLF